MTKTPCGMFTLRIWQHQPMVAPVASGDRKYPVLALYVSGNGVCQAHVNHLLRTLAIIA
jgi:hypothetical protein